MTQFSGPKSKHILQLLMEGIWIQCREVARWSPPHVKHTSCKAYLFVRVMGIDLQCLDPCNVGVCRATATNARVTDDNILARPVNSRV